MSWADVERRQMDRREAAAQAVRDAEATGWKVVRTTLYEGPNQQAKLDRYKDPELPASKGQKKIEDYSTGP